MGDVVMMLARVSVYYCTQLQLTIIFGSTEAEFVNMANVRKTALYIPWILEELGLIQKDPTSICANNYGAIHMVSAHSPLSMGA